MTTQPTYMQKPQEVQRTWHLIDAKDRVLGDVAAEIAQLLIGKNKPTFTPHVDGGDYVVVVNAAEVAVTGDKEQTKLYSRHSGIPGGFRQETFGDLLSRSPSKVFEHAVKGMLPKNTHQTPRLRRMKVFATGEHIYADKLSK